MDRNAVYACGSGGSLLKDAAFAEEREWRLLYTPLHKRDSVAARGARLTSYIDVDVSKPPTIPSAWAPDDAVRKQKQLPNSLPLTTVWIGPSRVQELTRLGAKVMLENCAYPNGINLELSRVPYRSI